MVALRRVAPVGVLVAGLLLIAGALVLTIPIQVTALDGTVHGTTPETWEGGFCIVVAPVAAITLVAFGWLRRNRTARAAV